MFMMNAALIRKRCICLLLLLFSLKPLQLISQSVTTDVVSTQLNEERDHFMQHLRYITIDPQIVLRLTTFVETEADSMHQSLLQDTFLPDMEKIKAIQSLVYFIRELSEKMYLQKAEVYELPLALHSYQQLLQLQLHQQPFIELLKPLSSTVTQFLAAAFWHYPQSDLLNDVAVYKRVSSAPDYILQFLESQPGFRFADSLVVTAAAHDPVKLITYLQKPPSVLQEKIRRNPNMYVQQIIQLTGERNVSELLPFIIPLAEQQITVPVIIEKRREVPGYYQLLVTTLMQELSAPPDSSTIFLASLRKAMKEKALLFFVENINELHASPDAVRFAEIKKLRPEDIYYIITSCEKELYTSSYLGLYSRLIERYGTPTADSLFEVVHYDQFNQFMRMAANYNTLSDFLRCMPEERGAALIKRFIAGIERTTGSGLEKAMDIADSFTGLSSDKSFSQLIRAELQSNLNRTKAEQLFFGVRLYSILLEVFDRMQAKDTLQSAATAKLGNNQKLERKHLLNKHGEILQLVLFYGDEDGIASFKNFMELFRDFDKWEICKNEQWVSIRSKLDTSLLIYANLPLDAKQQLDLQAQDSLFIFLQQQSAEPTILIHRGHSYHLTHTMKRMKASVKLAILGSCGGYNSMLSVADISPDAQIIVSKKIGSKLINDPIIEVINETLQDCRDLVWTEVWEKLTIRFSKDETAQNLFNEYIPPTKNVSLFVLKLFNASDMYIYVNPAVE